MSRALTPAAPALSAVPALSPAATSRRVADAAVASSPPSFYVQRWGTPKPGISHPGGGAALSRTAQTRPNRTGPHLPGAAAPRGTDSALPMGGRSGAGEGREGLCGALRVTGHARAVLCSLCDSKLPPCPAPLRHRQPRDTGGTRAERTGTGSALIGSEWSGSSRARLVRLGWAQPKPVQPQEEVPTPQSSRNPKGSHPCARTTREQWN